MKKARRKTTEKEKRKREKRNKIKSKKRKEKGKKEKKGKKFKKGKRKRQKRNKKGQKTTLSYSTISMSFHLWMLRNHLYNHVCAILACTQSATNYNIIGTRSPLSISHLL